MSVQITGWCNGTCDHMYIANYLSDGFVGVSSTQNAHHAILVPGMFAIVLYKSRLVIAQSGWLLKQHTILF
jgi:hypothetical protein